MTAATPARREWTLPAAAMLATAETVVLLVALFAREGHGPGVGPVAGLLLKLVFCWGVVRRGPASFLVLVFYEGAALLFAVAVGGSPMLLRAAVAALAATVLALLVASARLFPTVTLPKP